MNTTESMLKIDNVSKKYKLGQIGGTTLRDELQRKRAKRKGLEDPTARIGAKSVNVGEEFYALSNISFEVKKGERIGIIGHNGAGKSTLLKLISRVTAPTQGSIYMNGRVASMLEVGTGFHPELTGRENIYMNGAILGMSKKEIDSKIEDIIDFSEVRQFIDTPVKRYSSGMYVKLAFSVAAHLDSEILIMDEVLAVGDMAFQKKCLDKMNDVSRQDGRTILYVSHNMNTIRQLCDRVIVLDHGQIVFDGGVEEGIDLYLGCDKKNINKLDKLEDLHEFYKPNMPIIKSINLNSSSGIMSYGDNMHFSLSIHNPSDREHKLYIRIIMKNTLDNVIMMSSIKEAYCMKPCVEECIEVIMNTSNVVPGEYRFSFVLYEVGELNTDRNIDVLRDVANISIKASPNFNHGMQWNPRWWGSIFNDYLIIK